MQILYILFSVHHQYLLDLCRNSCISFSNQLPSSCCLWLCKNNITYFCIFPCGLFSYMMKFSSCVSISTKTAMWFIPFHIHNALQMFSKLYQLNLHINSFQTHHNLLEQHFALIHMIYENNLMILPFLYISIISGFSFWQLFKEVSLELCALDMHTYGLSWSVCSWLTFHMKCSAAVWASLQPGTCWRGKRVLSGCQLFSHLFVPIS